MNAVESAFAEMPLVAILRGVRPDEVVAIAEALYVAGIRLVEVPLNSPDPLRSIAALEAVRGRMVWGAGTVLRPADVDAVADAGGEILVTPNTNAEVIRRGVERGMTPMPGFATASEAFVALEAGARHLKLFPAATYGPDHLKALKSVLPADAVLIPVGGVGPASMASWWAAGARGFGLGSDLYKPGMTAADVGRRAVEAVQAVHALREG
ncbi:2-dehydro-3-deoxy-6-phosphogalactonate aldolase [Sphingomonas quercus]|uniref:2-dehydro-3-deoxy-6-phosphogalactonate aldolase n=1 Tax=Sphingomonas quercus TaxID=2842451 RepID=A0ABS6BL61_9SPHN|nr:2-dehydro-3-deoxy-6-phosphogalactonate aldolase [Sphingomonas quercus]MBU3079052.1 2-dehydro-3-deoxy-6-phosphogalactonate aldolase [Sphingomonas quercus]